MRTIVTSIFLYVCLIANAQSVSQIKADKSYIYGEGWGSTLKQADNQALQDLTSKISVNVQSSFSSTIKELTIQGENNSFENLESLVKTYSQATLTNTNRIVISNEPDAQVLRYIKVSEVNRIFEGRKQKVINMVETAERAERKGKIDDALRYYYWGYELLKSLQYYNEVKYMCPDNKERVLATWIPEQMNDIFSNLKINTVSKSGNEIQLRILYKDKPVTSFDYTYFDGMDWSNIYSAKDGIGTVDLRPGAVADNIKIKCEFEFSGEAHIDREIESVMALVSGSTFRDAYFSVPANATIANSISTPASAPTQTASTNAFAKSDINYTPYRVILGDIFKGIHQKNYAAINKYFTPKGKEQFDKLINYGKATILDKANIEFNSLGEKVISRGMFMSFGFKNNNRKFVENVVFIFDKDKKVDAVQFGLGEEAYKDIMSKGVWSQDARLILNNFLEEYQTAYALKNLDYIKNVFDDNAIIITGRVSRRPQMRTENQAYIDNKVIKFTKQSKTEYIRNLAHCFAGNEFINIRFANNDIVKSGKGGETYGIQIKQDYYSSTYGDTGYLFLMIDVNDPDNPSIKVRTWQPEKDPNFGIIGLSDF